MEVRGYADAAEWVYGHAIDSGSWTPGKFISLTDVRHVHNVAMKTVWDIAPHPDATPNEEPGSFREHDIRPFPGGMVPPSWVLVHEQGTAWVDEVNTIEPREDVFPEGSPERIAASSRFTPLGWKRPRWKIAP